jgi:hypothetical protein
MSKSNVHPNRYKTAGRDRQDDAAAARQARSIAAKPSSRERPDRMSKGPYFQHPEPTRDTASEKRTGPAEKKLSTRRARPKTSSKRSDRISKARPAPERSTSKKKK